MSEPGPPPEPWSDAPAKPPEAVNPYASPRPIEPGATPFPGAGGGYYLPAKPAMATVFGVMNIVWGVLGVFAALQKLLLVAMGIFFLVMFGVSPDVRDDFPLEEGWLPLAMVGIALLILLAVAWLAVDIVCEVLLFRSATKLLQGRTAGRTLALRYCTWSLASQLVPIVLIVAAAVVIGIVGFREDQSPEEASRMVGQIIGQSVGYCIGLIYPGVQMVLMRQPSFAQALAVYEATYFPGEAEKAKA